MKLNLEYLEAACEGKLQKWECTYFCNNRGTIFVYILGRKYFRQDKGCRTKKIELIRQGWKPCGPAYRNPASVKGGA